MQLGSELHVVEAIDIRPDIVASPVDDDFSHSDGERQDMDHGAKQGQPAVAMKGFLGDFIEVDAQEVLEDVYEDIETE